MALMTFTHAEIIQQPINIICPDPTTGYSRQSGIKHIVGEEPFRKRSSAVTNKNVLTSILSKLDLSGNPNPYEIVQKIAQLANGGTGNRRELQRNNDVRDDVGNLPWTCTCKEQIYDLGQGVVPRFISGAKCSQKTCWYGHYRCVPITTEATVLVKHYGMCFDRRLPPNLSDKYMAYTLSVQVGSNCGQP